MIGIMWLAAGGVVALLGGVWMIAYRVGFSEGRLTIPLRMITALTEHQVGCQSTDPEQMARELVHHLGFQEVEARRLVARATSVPRARRSASLRSAP